MSNIILFAILIFSFAVNGQELCDDMEKRDFLEAIFFEDQGIRQSIITCDTILNDSIRKLCQSNIYDEMRRLDSINVKKIEWYLSIHSYPKVSELGEIAACVPWAVIHHTGKQEVRFKFYPLMRMCYYKELIDKTSFEFYAWRAITIETGKKINSVMKWSMPKVIRKMDKLYENYQRVDN